MVLRWEEGKRSVREAKGRVSRRRVWSIVSDTIEKSTQNISWI